MCRFRARTQCLAFLTIVLCLVAGCTQPRFTLRQAATLNSLRQVDDWPLYVMHYRGAYAEFDESYEDAVRGALDRAAPAASAPAWGCALFAALGDPANRLYGRGMDYKYSPAVLLFTRPPDGYASVSMVDIAYLGFEGEDAQGLDKLPLDERRPLLQAPYVPFDGMNERGLAIGMATVPFGGMRIDPDKETLNLAAVMREVLDHAADVDEALAILDRYNIDFLEFDTQHYLIADRSGRAALAEFFLGERIVLRNQQPWHLATNFPVSLVETPQGQCERYDRLDQLLAESQGALTPEQAMEGLAAVAGAITSFRSTQWSITYNLSTGQVQVAMGGNFDQVYTYNLKVKP